MVGRTILIVMTALAMAASLAGCGSSSSGQSTTGQGSLRAIAGYFAPWNPAGISALGKGALTEVSPVWYQPEPGGLVIIASPDAQRTQSAIESQASSRNIAIIPSISNFRNGQWDGALIHQIISTPQMRATHITAIIDLVTSHRWAGIDIDYESLQAADRDAYSAFIRDLATALHQRGKRLSVTVHAKISEPGDWSGARAQNWRALGQSADEVRVMAYDYSTEESPPGPIAPRNWVQSVLQLAVSEIPREKIMLGVATYGYDWAGGQKGQDLRWADAKALASDHNIPVKWDPASESPWFSYTDDRGLPHTVWYENARSMQDKLDLARQYHVAGVFIWVLGGEDPAIWEPLRQAK
jgi:spore germination protein